MSRNIDFSDIYFFGFILTKNNAIKAKALLSLKMKRYLLIFYLMLFSNALFSQDTLLIIGAKSPQIINILGLNADNLVYSDFITQDMNEIAIDSIQRITFMKEVQRKRFIEENNKLEKISYQASRIMNKVLNFKSDLKELNNEEFDSYLASDGVEYKIGDTIIIGNPSPNSGQSYNNQGILMKTFLFIGTGDGIFTPIKQSKSEIAGTKSRILKIFVDGNRLYGHKVFFRTDAPIFTYKILFEDALKSGEIESNGMTKQKAIKLLEEEKRKLDLELITKEQYNLTKERLKKYILE